MTEKGEHRIQKTGFCLGWWVYTINRDKEFRKGRQGSSDYVLVLETLGIFPLSSSLQTGLNTKISFNSKFQ